MIIEYAIRRQREHAMGGKEQGWSERDHEEALLNEMGMNGWILSTVKPYIGAPTFYFYRIVGA